MKHKANLPRQGTWAVVHVQGHLTLLYWALTWELFRSRGSIWRCWRYSPFPALPVYGACGNHISTSGCTVWVWQAHRKSHLQDQTQASVRAHDTVPYMLGSLRLFQDLKPQKFIQSPASGRRKQEPWPSPYPLPSNKEIIRGKCPNHPRITNKYNESLFLYTPPWISRIQGGHKPPAATTTTPKYFLQPPSHLEVDLNLCLTSWQKLLLQV